MPNGFMAGAIVSKLTLDKSQWSKSINDVKNDEKKMSGMSDRMSAGFTKMGTAMTVAGAAILASLGAMVNKYVETGDWIDKMSKRTGFSATALSELAYAADISGASLENVEKSLKKMSMAIVDANSGLVTYTRYFDMIGVDYKELQGMAPEEQFLKIGVAIAGMSDKTEQAAMASQLFGRAGITLLPLFKEGEEGMRKLREEAHELGIIFDKEAAAKAAELKDAQTALKGALQGVTIVLAQTLVPALTKFAKGATEIVVKIREWADAHPGLVSIITKVVGVLGGVLTILGPILIILPKLVAGLAMLKGAFLALTGPIGLVTAAAVAAYAIFNKLKKAKEYLAEATERADAQEKRLIDKLKEAADAAGWTRAEFAELTEKYKGNAAAMAMAIKHGKEGADIQKSLAEIGKENVKAWEAQRGAVDKVSDAYKKNREETKAVTNLIKTMADEIKKHTLDEYEYRKQKATEIYNERKALLEKEGADRAAFAQAEKAYNLELADIEKDRTEAFKLQQKEKREEEKKTMDEKKRLHDAAEGFISQYTDTVNQLTMSELEYKQWALEEWYRQELKTLQDSLGNTQEYVNAKAALDEAFQAKTVELSRSTTDAIGEHWRQLIDGISYAFGDFVMRTLEGGTTLKDSLGQLWQDIKGSFFSMIADAAAQWMKGFITQLITGATQAGASITASLGTAITSLTTGLVSLVASVAQSLITVAQAIATAAQILASAAAALAKVGLVAIALYAAFTLVKGIINKLLGGGGAGDVVSRLDNMTRHLSEIQAGTDYLKVHWWDANKHWHRTAVGVERLLQPLRTTMHNTTRCDTKLGKILAKIGSSAVGEYVPKASLRVVGEEVPELIAPIPEVKRLVETSLAAGAGMVKREPPQVNVVQNVNLQYSVKDAVDGDSVRKLVREKVLPETVEALKVNYRGVLSEARKVIERER